jgi:heme exporter protein D
VNWGSVGEFFAMGGYAPYVWGSYAVTFGLLAFEIAWLAVRRRRLLRELTQAGGGRA